ncbi:TPA: hypothetical protein ON581_000097 [Proteus mirabilis]|uniref:hypothetical protein n=1 Tax=Proteus mirabilis TaxID=584 RepID=UPI0015E80C1D|nr:hypothetical protein [Proteus mirabilis]MDM9028012.1 hypothetical protein [Proteus mirabilis]HCR3451547.1 hypothetical protein [Proteus mirabilis]
MCELSFSGKINIIRSTQVKDKIVYDVMLEDQSAYFHIVCKDTKLAEILSNAKSNDTIFAKGEVKLKESVINNIVKERFYILPFILSINGVNTYQTKSEIEIDEEARQQHVRSLERIRELTDILNFNKSRNSLDESNKKLEENKYDNNQLLLKSQLLSSLNSKKSI